VIDRQRVAGVLLVLGAGLAAAGSFQRTFSTVYAGYGQDLTISTTLWVTTSEPVDGPSDQPAFYAAGWPVIVSALVMAVAVALMARERIAFVGRPLAVGGAGALAGIVFFYVAQVRRQEELLNSGRTGSAQDELHYHGGMYLLVVGAIIALVGAALAQQRYQRQEQEPEQEDEVVVHQLDSDDDTPPFGLMIPNDDDQQETR
jgi:hypothetical protein